MDELHLKAIAYFSGALAVGLGAIGSGISIGLATGSTLRGMSRQPPTQDALLRDMLIGQALAGTPSVFALVMGIILLFAVDPTPSLVHAAAILGAGLSIGLGAFGSSYGGGVIAARAIEGIARNPGRGGAAMRTMVLGQALCQTTVVYALLVSLILWAFGANFGMPGEPARELVRAAALLGAGLSMGFGAIGPAIGTSDVGAVAAESLAARPEAETPVTRTFFVGAAVSQTTSIYALVVSLILIWVIPA